MLKLMKKKKEKDKCKRLINILTKCLSLLSFCIFLINKIKRKNELQNKLFIYIYIYIYIYEGLATIHINRRT
jgi:hypothetical protein